MDYQFQKATDFQANPWFAPGERDAWDRARKLKWTRGLTPDLRRELETTAATLPAHAVGSRRIAVTREYDVALVTPNHVDKISGVKFGMIGAWAVMAFQPE